MWYAGRTDGLLALRACYAFDRRNLACPDGWASGGQAEWYQSQGLSSDGAAYMDYAYWVGRYRPGDVFDVRAASFAFTPQKSGEPPKILVTDVITDMNSESKVTSLLGAGNHGSNHLSSPVNVQWTDGRGNTQNVYNRIQSFGGTALFSDRSVVWFAVEKHSQQSDGLCYPPCDRW